MDGQREFTIRGNGENLIDFMYVDDAVDGFLTLTSSAGFSGTVDFASGAPVSVNAVVADDGAGARRRRHAPARRAHRGIHPVSHRRSHDARSVRLRAAHRRSKTACGGCIEFLLEERDGAGQPA